MNDDQASPGMKEKAANLKESVKEKVAPVQEKAVNAWEKTRGTVTNAKEAVSGFVDEAKKNDLAGKSKEAMQKAGETTREIGTAAKDEVQQTKESIRSAPGSESSGKRDQIDTTSY